MNNPFITGSKKQGEFTGGGYFSDYIQGELSTLEIGETKMINRCGKNIAATRSMIQYASIKLDIKIKTKVSEDNLWIKRTK